MESEVILVMKTFLSVNPKKEVRSLSVCIKIKPRVKADMDSLCRECNLSQADFLEAAVSWAVINRDELFQKG